MDMSENLIDAEKPSSAQIDEEARQIVIDIGIPPCPAILTRLLRDMREDEPDFAAIGKMLSSDMSLAASMLKTVNSPFYGLGRKATSIQQALALLGLQNVARLVTGLLLQQVFAVSNSEAMEDFWSNAARVAALTAQLARTLRCADRDEAYTFGLFRDCGMPLMASRYADYADLLGANALAPGRTLLEVEEERYGVNHALVGFHMATGWYLSAKLCQAIQHHHNAHMLAKDGPLGGSSVLVALGVLAERIDTLSQEGEAAVDALWPVTGPAVLRCLEITEDDVVRLTAEALALEN
ncbi:MAG: HDOD domain-containing protein [Betaproteobacteria bacterium]